MSGNHEYRRMSYSERLFIDSAEQKIAELKKFARQELLAAADSLYDKECAIRQDIGQAAIDLPEYKARQRAIDAAERICEP